KCEYLLKYTNSLPFIDTPLSMNFSIFAAMNIEQQLKERANHTCELCHNTAAISVYEVPPVDISNVDNCILVCEICKSQIEKKEQLDSNHWKVLSDTMWSEYPAVQVVAWRILSRLRNESWASDNLEILYLDDNNLEWAKKTGDHEQEGTVEFHQDSNGVRLYDGDTVVLIKTLDVKGSSLSAKLGTVVKNIKLVQDNIEQIE